jgi:hypothetical protein
VGKEAGWAIIEKGRATAGSGLDDLVQEVIDAIKRDSGVALGFECPLYVPLRSTLASELKGRVGEGSPPWCVGAGAHSLAVGLGQAALILARIKRAIPSLCGTTRWGEFMGGAAKLFIWEAYVTSRQGESMALPTELASRISSHAKDALAAVLRFAQVMNDGVQSDLVAEPALSLAGLHLINTELATDLSLLRETCVVLKARKPQ